MFDITKATVEELKAMAYDTLGEIERQQNNLRVLNNEIAKRGQEGVDTKEKEVKKEK